MDTADSSSSEDSQPPLLPKGGRYRNMGYSPDLWDSCEIHYVDSIPHDVDGHKKFRLNCAEKEFMDNC